VVGLINLIVGMNNPNNNINAVYEYEETGSKCAVKRPKYY